MEKIAVENGSVISAAMLGALAGAGVLPFPREAYEAAIRVSAKGIAPSLKTFAEAFSQTKGNPPAAGSTAVTKRFSQLPAATGKRELDDLVVRIRGGFQVELHDMLFAGVRKLTDFQDARYATAYLDRMSGLVRIDTSPSHAFALAAAKHVANAMAYDDVIRVADLKTKASRFDRVKAGAGVAAGQIAYMTEFMHPRMEEIVGILPDGLGRWLENHPRLFQFLDRRISRGRRVRTGTVGWFLVLYAVAALRPLRRRSLRHHRETQHMDDWLAIATSVLPRNHDLAVEVIACRRLIKGYSDTHARGLSKFDRVLGALPMLVSRDDGAAWLRRLREAALADEEGKALDGALQTVASL